MTQLQIDSTNGPFAKILEACSNYGPGAEVDEETGWARDNRWVRWTDIFEPTDGSERYNGLGWLVLHNFHQLVYAGE